MEAIQGLNSPDPSLEILGYRSEPSLDHDQSRLLKGFPPCLLFQLPEFGQDDGQQLGAADSVVEVPQFDDPGFELANQAGADSAASGQVPGRGLLAEQPFVGQPYRILQGADRDAEDLLVRSMISGVTVWRPVSTRPR